MEEIKKFIDLVFEPHHIGNGVKAKLFFSNGYGISVVRFKIVGSPGIPPMYGSYTDNENEWEVAVLNGSENDYVIAKDVDNNDWIRVRLTPPKVEKLMIKIQKLGDI